MEPDNGEYISVTYMYLKKGKWKTKTDHITVEDLPKYQNDKYRILGTMNTNEYYSLIE